MHAQIARSLQLRRLDRQPPAEASTAQGSRGPSAVSVGTQMREWPVTLRQAVQHPLRRPGTQDSAATASETRPSTHAEQRQPQRAEPPGAASQEHNASQDRQAPPEEVLPDVDVEEQRRIMRDIWLRQHVNRGQPQGYRKQQGSSCKEEAEARERAWGSRRCRRKAAQDQRHVQGPGQVRTAPRSVNSAARELPAEKEAEAR